LFTPLLERREVGVLHRVGLVEDVQHRTVERAELLEHLVDHEPVLLPHGVARVDHVQQQVGVLDLLERRAERGDEVVGELADEPHRVGEERVERLTSDDLARERVERGEQPVLDEHVARPAQPAQHRRLAGVRVAHERGAELGLPPARCTSRERCTASSRSLSTRMRCR
jgi:hypothetical protein